jgi:hypothetical protein
LVQSFDRLSVGEKDRAQLNCAAVYPKFVVYTGARAILHETILRSAFVKPHGSH